MDWKEEYSKKVVSAEEALKHVKNNDRVIFAHACGEPAHLVNTLVELKENFRNVEIVHMVPMGPADYCKEENREYFVHNALFAGGATKSAIKEGRADFTPIFFHEAPKLLRSKMHVNVALVQVSKPDEHGYVSLGVSVDYTKAAVETADITIAQVNKYMPRTLGDSFVHVSDIDYFVEYDEPIHTLASPKIGEIEKSIGKYCASLINDGDTLQLGIGAIPDAVLSFLTEKKDLGIHSEMISDGVVNLVEKGVINNSKKTINKGKMVVTFLMGSEKLYNYVDNNPAVSMMPVDYVNNPVVIMQEDNIVCINSCVQVDLMGQVCSESIGGTQISGVGGQVDFVRGAAMAKNGRAIIAMPSTVKGKISKIVAKLDDYSAVTTSRNDVDYVITEYGIAELKGKSLRERSKALIKIAHPDFREELIRYHNEKFSEDFKG